MLFAQIGLALAVASGDPRPIAIDGCQVLHTRSFVSAFRPVIISFTNLRTTSAIAVDFTVEYAGHSEHITDSGLFAQNVRIDHRFAGFYNVRYAGPPPRCSVDYVKFSDGSRWGHPPRS